MGRRTIYTTQITRLNGEGGGREAVEKIYAQRTCKYFGICTKPDVNPKPQNGHVLYEREGERER